MKHVRIVKEQGDDYIVNVCKEEEHYHGRTVYIPSQFINQSIEHCGMKALRTCLD